MPGDPDRAGSADPAGQPSTPRRVAGAAARRTQPDGAPAAGPGDRDLGQGEPRVSTDTLPTTGQSVQTKRASMFAALRHRNYRIYVSGSLVSNVGTWMQ